MSIQVDFELKEILNQLNQKLDKMDSKFEQKLDKLEQKIDNVDNKFENKLDKIDDRLNNLEKGQGEMRVDLDNVKEDIKEIKGSQKAQIWTLIGVLITAVGGFIVAVARSVLSFNL